MIGTQDDLYTANKSQLTEQALHPISSLYEVERQARDMSDEDRWRIRQEMAVPIIETLHDWMLAQRDLVPHGSATAKALDHSLKRWVALTRYLDDGVCPSTTNRSRCDTKSLNEVVPFCGNHPCHRVNLVDASDADCAAYQD